MSLESGDYINDLVKTNPAPTDLVNQGDDHLKLVKKVLKQTFPGSGGQGFSKPITASETELNYVDGVTSPIQTQINDAVTAADTAYVAKNDGNQSINGTLDVKERVTITADTDTSDYDGFEVLNSAGDLKCFFAYDELNDDILIGQRDANGLNETIMVFNDGRVTVLSDTVSTVPETDSDLANKKYVDDNSGGYPTSIPYPTPGNNHTYAVAPTRLQVADEVSVLASINSPNNFFGYSIYTPNAFNFNKPVLHGAFAYDTDTGSLSIYQGDDAADGGSSDTVATFKDGNLEVWSGVGLSTAPVKPNDLCNKTYVDGVLLAATGQATGASGTFEDNNGNTITVSNGLIVSGLS